MIDIETLGLPPDGAIVAIGAAFFDTATATIGPTFYKTVHLATSVRAGMKIDPATVMWWLRQDAKAQAAIAYNGVALHDALMDFSAFIAEHSSVKDVRVWGNGAAFDLTILNTAYKLCGIETPWTFARETCFRTVRNMNPAIPYKPEERKSVHHHALDDVLFQIEHLFKVKAYNDAHPRTTA